MRKILDEVPVCAEHRTDIVERVVSSRVLHVLEAVFIMNHGQPPDPLLTKVDYPTFDDPDVVRWLEYKRTRGEVDTKAPKRVTIESAPQKDIDAIVRDMNGSGR